MDRKDQDDQSRMTPKEQDEQVTFASLVSIAAIFCKIDFELSMYEGAIADRNRGVKHHSIAFNAPIRPKYSPWFLFFQIVEAEQKSLVSRNLRRYFILS